MGAQDLYDVTLIPSLGPEDVGLPPLGPPPQAPVFGPPPTQGRSRKATAIGAAIASLIGGPAAYGVPRGVLQGFDDQDYDQRARDVEAFRVYDQQGRDYDQQVRGYQQAHQSRQQQLQQAVRTIQAQAQTLKTKAEYDTAVETYARMLQGAGFRVDGNWLRQAVPYVKPNVEKEARALYDDFVSKPNNKKLMETNPEEAHKGFVLFDRDGDGDPEQVSVADLGVLARLIATDKKGKPVYAPPEAGKLTELKANADGILAQLVEKAKAEGKPITPELMITLQREAIKLVDQAKPEDPYLTEMRRMRTEEMRRRGNIPGDLSPAQFNMANRLADDFTRDSKDFIARSQSYQTVLAAGKDQSPAGDLSLIFAYMKMLDPGSVVREGEFATAQNTAGVPDRIRNAYNKLISGERLTPAQRADFTRQAANVYGASKARQDRILETYRGRAGRAQVPPELVIMDYGIAAPETTSSDATMPDAKTRAADKLKGR